MQRFLLIAFLFSYIYCFSQPGAKSSRENLKQQLIINDSVLKRMQFLNDSVSEAIRKKEALEDIQKMASRSADYFVRLQKERRAAEKKNALIRIGIGIAFLILLIFGLRRRVKKTKS
ncbi:MAG: hypothetical protein ABUT20_50655 [Bacteroidota bacterium]